MWLLDFISTFFTLAEKDRTVHLSHCAKEAYSQSLGPHHPWVVRQAAKVAMYACPGREVLMESTKLEYGQISEILICVDAVRKSLWDLYKEKGIDNL